MTEEEKINIKEQFNYIVKNGIAPILKSAGFRKKGNNFHAHAGELDWCINIQKDGWGFDRYFNQWGFTINIGVTWSDYAICLFNKVSDFPLEGYYPIRARIGTIMGKGDYWFKLRPHQDCSPVKDLICSTIKEKVLPLLNDIKCLNDLWNFIEDNRPWHTFLIKLFHVKSKQKVFSVTPIDLYVLCLATGKTKKAKLLRRKMERRKANTSLLDKIDEMYKSRGISP